MKKLNKLINIYLNVDLEDIIVRAEGVWKKYAGRYVLQNVNLRVKKGDKLVVLGANGAGKSTLVRILLGIEKPTKGIVYRKGAIGYVPDFNPKFDLEAVEDLLDFLDVNNINTLEKLEVKKFLKRRLKTLSKGELRRVLIAIALAKGRDLPILDEPYNGLDPDGRRILRSILRELQTYIFITHLIEEIPEGANRLIFIENGQIVMDCKKGVKVYAYRGAKPDTEAYGLGNNLWITKKEVGKLIF